LKRNVAGLAIQQAAQPIMPLGWGANLVNLLKGLFGNS
jgi:hypothetical protein